ncbi:MAG TPA: ATP-binding cassette domain-containing protein [Rhodothermales bacterium]|nr:ATP-binding cassette domain-containing protein [Rhodothermales bacterium]
MSILTVDHVTKRYGQFAAVDDVTFESHPGRILGLLGPNGAGKTSTIRMIAYITVPDEGRVLYGGREVGPWSQMQMGYLPEERGLYKKLKVGEQLLYLSELKGLKRSEARARIHYWLERFDALSWAGKKTEELSKGMQQKMQFIATMIHDPTLLILDEPFSGLDPINSELLREIILELKEKGRTILFASHRMEQVEQMCDDICLISQGRIVLQGPLRDVKRSFGRETVLLDFEGDASFLDGLAAQGLVRLGARSLSRVEINLLNGTPPRLILEKAMQNVKEIHRFELVEPSLNEIFVRVVGKQAAAAQAPQPATV